MGISAGATAAIGLGTTLFGGVTSAMGAMQSARIQEANLRYQKAISEANAKVAEAQQGVYQMNTQVGEMNAKIANQAAEAALGQGQRDKNISRLKTAHLKSQQRAVLAANGIDLGVGTAAELQYSAQLMGNIDAATITENAVRAAFGHRVQAMNANISAVQANLAGITNRGQITSMQNDALIKGAAADGISPGMAGFTSLLGSAGQVASSWYAYKKTEG